ncbi:MAG: sensor histidine kinase [Vicinamibacterales bacterium]
MSTRPSLRSRLFIGSVAWALGLMVLMSVIMSVFVRFHPAYPDVAHYGALMSGALIFTVVGLSLLYKSLSPLGTLRERLIALREGREARVVGDYPVEVQPLVDDLNALLAQREEAIRRALAKAGDLAHGLKTPLAVLSHEAERAERAGHVDTAASIGQQVERMRRQVNYHLAQARAAASGAALGARASLKESADGLARTLLRLHADRGLTIAVDVDASHEVRVQREDLDEMLGNLLDNACRFARARVSVNSARRDSAIVITIDDDGPGLEAAMRDAVLQRGVRADEARSGSGLGLAIVGDLADLYGGSIGLDSAPSDGLRARLSLPSA